MTPLAHLSEKLLKKNVQSSVFIGFDGFTDEILTVVDKRQNPQTFQPITSIPDFAQRILSASGKSTNIELVLKQKKLGGNAPIMTNALLNFGHRITFAGAIGENQIEPLFQEMARQCEKTYSLCSSGHSDALEFSDGKIIFGKMNDLITINYSLLIEKMGQSTLTQTLEESRLFACTNWTMLPYMTDLWKGLITHTLPHLSKRQRWLFIDIADPAKRSDNDIKEALNTLAAFNKSFDVVLGLNQSEFQRLTTVLQLNSPDTPSLAKQLQQHTGFKQIVVHFIRTALCATSENVTTVEGYYCEHPKLTTGAGDNFNAGYCHGLLNNYTIEECLTCGVATSGYYVRYGQSPAINELAKLIST